MAAEKRILYIEDNFENRLFVRRVLEADGMALLEAEDGALGLQMVAAEQPDLILLDIGLPDIDGLDLAAQIRRAKLAEGVSIIALTANAMKGDEERCLAAGCDAYLTKPISVMELRAHVKKYLK